MKNLIVFAVLALFVGGASAASLDLRAFTGSADQGVTSGSQTSGQSGAAAAFAGLAFGTTQSGVVSGQTANANVTPTGITNTTAGGTAGQSTSAGGALGLATGGAGSSYGGAALGTSLGSFDAIGLGVVVLP